MKREPLRLVAGAQTLDEATVQLFRRSLLMYAQLISEKEETDTHMPDETLAWASGRTYEEWLGNGLLNACRQAVQVQGSLRASRIHPESLTSPETALHLKLLRLRSQLEIELFAVELPIPSAHLILVFVGGEFWSEGMGRSRQEAMSEALVAALSRAQLEEHDPERLRETSDWLYPVEAYEQEGQPESEALVDWSLWNEKAQTELSERNLDVAVLPWNLDSTLLRVGVLLGKVGMRAKSGEVVQ